MGGPNLGRAPIYMQQARVVGVDTQYRKLTIEWLGQEGSKNNVIPLTGPGDYSLPKKGATGLVLGAGGYNYWLGKIDVAYADKIKGTYKDPETNLNIKYTEVDGGEIQLNNVSHKTKLKLSNTGDMSLLNGFRQGFKYFSQMRWSQVMGEVTSLVGNGVRLTLGNAMRSGPMGDTPVPGTTGAGKTLEALLEVAFNTGAATIQYAKFHMGELKDLVTGLVPLLSSLGTPLRIMLQANNDTGIEASYLKMDTVGNMELKASTGLLSLDSGMPAASILLGPFIGTAEPVIKGLNYTTNEANYLTAESTWVGAESALITALNTFSVAMSAAATAGSTTPSAISWGIVGGAAAALVAACTAALTANGVYTASNATFATSLPAALSTKVMTS